MFLKKKIQGVQKGGTSALNALLKRHRRLIRSKYFEPHFFDRHPAMMDNMTKQLLYKLSGVEQMYIPEKYNINNPYETPPLICDLREIYALSCFDLPRIMQHPVMLTYEKTPAYIFMDDAAKFIQTMAPWAKIIISLRNPVDRYVVLCIICVILSRCCCCCRVMWVTPFLRGELVCVRERETQKDLSFLIIFFEFCFVLILILCIIIGFLAFFVCVRVQGLFPVQNVGGNSS